MTDESDNTVLLWELCWFLVTVSKVEDRVGLNWV